MNKTASKKEHETFRGVKQIRRTGVSMDANSHIVIAVYLVQYFSIALGKLTHYYNKRSRRTR